MTLYSLYLGWRKSYEERLVTIPENIQRCPFVMGMLQQSKTSESVQTLAGVTSTWRFGELIHDDTPIIFFSVVLLFLCWFGLGCRSPTT